MDTFTWQPSAGGSAVDVKYRTLNAQFGDGYAQVAADGINNAVTSAQLTFIGKSADMQPIINFLNAKAGAVSFYWTPSLGTQGMYRCKNPQVKSDGADTHTITATFEQSFAP